MDEPVVLISDVGVVDGIYHTGDEAMLECAIEQLRRRGLSDITVLSEGPSDTAGRYQVESVMGLRGLFEGCVDDEDRGGRIAELLDAVDAGLPTTVDPAVEAIRTAGSVVIAGGGNLTSDWPDLIAERLAVAELCRLFGRDLVLTSQSVGPRLEASHRASVARIAGIARLVGAREAASAALLRSLGIGPERVVHVPDDASALAADDVNAGPLLSVLPEAFVAMTFAPHPGLISPVEWVRIAAQAVRSVRQSTGLPVVLIPHEGRLDARNVRGGVPSANVADVEMHDRVMSELGDAGVMASPVATAAVSLALTARAALVVSTRYHQVVNAISSGVPVIGLCTDAYGENKIGGALRDAGLDDWSIAQLSLASGQFASLFEESWARREELAAHLRAGASERATRLTAWWDVVTGRRAVGADTDADSATPIHGPASLARRDLDDARRVRAEREWLLDASTHLDHARAEERLARSRDEHARTRISVEGLAETLSELEEFAQRVDNLEAALAAAHLLQSELADPLFARQLRAPGPITDGEALHAVLASRTFRWTVGPRRLYGSLRAGLLRRGHTR